MINRVVLTGRLTRDPELRTTGSGISVATFTLAVDRQYTNARGEREADFISCVIWRKSAENFVNFTSKGSLVGIDGRLQSRSYDDKDDKRVYVTEVVVDSFALLESRRDRENRGQNGGYTPTSGNAGTQNTNNFQNNDRPSQPNTNSSAPKPQDPFSGSGDAIDISDDDLPF